MIKVRVLLENQKCDKKYKNKHGLSLLINVENKKILLDAGSDNTFIKNGKIMNVNLEEVDYLLLSHSHIDHTGGLNSFDKVNKQAKIYLMDSICNKYYTKIFNRIMVSIGLKINNKVKSRIEEIKESVKICENVWFLKNDIRTYSQPSLNEVLYKRESNKYVVDKFEHEGILVVKDGNELVIFSSCTHSGVRNTIEKVKQEFAGLKIRSFIGGFHLYNPVSRANETDENLDKVVNEIKETGINFYTGHCTGEYSFQYIKKYLKEKISKIETGMEITI